MKDEDVLTWLMQMTTHVAELHSRRDGRPSTNAGPNFNDRHTFTVEPEDFSRWMGWRGQEAQEQETAWPAEELRQERKERHSRAFAKLREENAELRRFLSWLRDELTKRLGP